MQDQHERTVTQIELPARTIVRVVAVFVLIWLLHQLWDIILLTIIALMFTAALDPVVRRLQVRGMKRSWAVATVMTAVVIGLIGIVMILLSPVLTEGQEFIDDLPNQVDRLRGILGDNPELFERLQSAAESVAGGDSDAVTGGVKEVTFSVNLQTPVQAGDTIVVRDRLF